MFDACEQGATSLLAELLQVITAVPVLLLMLLMIAKFSSSSS